MESLNGENLLATVLAFEFPLHSHGVLSPSIFTVEKFAYTQEDIASLKKGIYGSLLLNAIFTGAMYFGYRKSKIPAIVAGLTSAGIFLYFNHLISQKTAPQELSLGGCKPLREEGCFNYLVDFKQNG